MSFKKTLYLFLTIMLLAVLSLLIYEIGVVSGLFIKQSVIMTAIILCSIGGYGLGQYRWRIVYIEKRRWKDCKKWFSKK